VIATVARLLCRELTLQNDCLRLENRILKQKVSGQIRFTDEERRSLAEDALAIGRSLMKEAASIVKAGDDPVLESAQPAPYGGASRLQVLWELAARDAVLLRTLQDMQALCHRAGTPAPGRLQSTLEHGHGVCLRLDEGMPRQALDAQRTHFPSGLLRMLTTQSPALPRAAGKVRAVSGANGRGSRAYEVRPRRRLCG